MANPDPSRSESAKEKAKEGLPREALLLKMLNMTTHSNDNQALVAIRKANELLSAAGWSWEKLLSGKITVVEDPFSKIADIKPNTAPHTAPSAPRAPTRAPTNAHFAPPPPSAPQPSRPHKPSDPGVGMMWVWNDGFDRWEVVSDPSTASRLPLSTKDNRYANHCYCCGIHVANNAGFIFNPSLHNPKASNGWQVICKDCNKNIPSSAVQASRAKKRFAAHQASSHVDLSDL